MSINKTRGILYFIAKLLGDLSALFSNKPDKTTKRVGRRVVGKTTGKIFNKLFK
jgi:hypothetical protein